MPTACSSSPSSTFGRCRSVTAALVAGLLLGACQRGNDAEAASTRDNPPGAATPMLAGSASEPKRSSQGRYSLGIVGYNYTEVGITDYSVNGTGAFNLSVSTEDSGGGSTICCFGWAPAAKLPMPIRIEWTRDGQKWCRKTVMLIDPGALEPTTFEVHFFPDRHIEVAITDNYSPPRVSLGRAGAAYRIGKDVRKEGQEAIQRDSQAAECRSGRFPIGG